MKSLAAALVLTAFISGCASGGGVGMRESPMWHSTAPMEVKIGHFQQKCEAFGHKPGTDAMASCIERSMGNSESNASDRMRAGAAMMQQQRPITCRTFGNTTTCQ